MSVRSRGRTFQEDGWLSAGRGVRRFCGKGRQRGTTQPGGMMMWITTMLVASSECTSMICCMSGRQGIGLQVREEAGWTLCVVCVCVRVCVRRYTRIARLPRFTPSSSASLPSLSSPLWLFLRCKTLASHTQHHGFETRIHLFVTIQ